MTSRIRRLPRAVVDRIAAGEVVERPASVVKELVENSLDAGATRIEVAVKKGGTELISVRDDGTGMGAADLELALTSHATSKLTDVSDLDHIGSLGFRGEALASISAVADCRIVSRERDVEDSEGLVIESRGGEVIPVKPAAAAPGTLIEVRHLFRYVPARRKFLRAPATETSHVTAAVHRLALAHPDVAFTLVRDDRRIFSVGTSDGRRERIARFYGRDLHGALLPASGVDGDLSLEGFVARPEAARPTANWLHVYLNGRSIRDRRLSHAVRHGYEGLLTKGRHPVVFLFLSMDPADVDVNVHPAKTEVRFRDGERVHKIVRRAVRDALLEADLAPRRFESLIAGPSSQTDSPGQLVAPTVPHDPAARIDGVREALTAFLAREDPAVVAGAERGTPPRASPAAQPAPFAAPVSAAPPARAVTRFLQVADLFIVYEDAEGLAIVDQHALHERILLEEIQERVLSGKLEVQPLLVPALVELPAADVELLLASAEELATLGVRVEPFGETTLAIRSLPSMLSSRDPARIVEGLLERLRVSEKAGGRGHLLETLMHSMACRSAIMSGDRLTEGQIAELLRKAGTIDTAQSCAHGRPTALKIPMGKLRRHFER